MSCQFQISKRNDSIRKLKNNIFSVEKTAEAQNHRVITEAARLESSELKSSDAKKSKLQQEIIELKKSVESETQVHRESELSLRKVCIKHVHSMCSNLKLFKRVLTEC